MDVAAMNVLALFTALIVKHFICDFPLQRAYQYRNKGKYGHPGGLLHAGIHGAATFAVLTGFSISAAAALALVEALIHYHIDWAKSQLTRRCNLNPEDDGFWIAIGADQLLHYLTYAGIIAWIG